MRTNWAPLPADMDAASRQLVESLRALKDSSRLTLAELGAKTHYSASSWERWLNGKRRITRAALLSIAEATDTDAGPLLDQLDRLDRLDQSELPDRSAAPTAPATLTRQDPTAPRIAGPVQLPRDLPDHVGREKELSILISALRDHDRAYVPVWAIVGMGGLGKTSLAVRAAHRAAPSYPDGILFLDLRGGTAEPLDADTALLRLLRSAGVPDTVIPADTDDRSALLRSTLARQRTLLVLDNAFDAAQVRPLLPGTPGCAVVITSRNQLAGLEGLRRVLPGPLSPDDARALLAQIAGGERFDAEPDDRDAILSVCAGLPLALRIAGSRLAVRPHWDLRALSSRLRSTAHRLDELAVDDLAVRTCFESSYAALIADDVELGEVRTLRLLGMWEGPEIGLGAAAALLDLTPEAAGHELERLTDISLVQSPAPGRYRFHDLLHSFVSERARLDLDVADQRAAIARLAAWYAHAAAAASDRLFDGRGTYDLAGIDAPAAVPRFADRDEALKWYDTESSALVPITRQAQALGLDAVAATLPQIFQIYLESRFKFDEWIETANLGLVSARRLGSALDQAHLQTALATAYGVAGQHAEAMAHSRDGMVLYEQAGDKLNQARAMDRLAAACELTGDLDRARDWLVRAIDLFEVTGYGYGAAQSLNRLGMMCTEAGLADEAVTHLERCLAVIEPLGSLGGQAATLGNLGQAYQRTGRHDRALASYLAADRLFTELDHQPGRATNLAMMGGFFRETGRPEQARRCLSEALAVMEAMNHPGVGEVRGMLEELESAQQ